jgi:DNA-binding NarL/FixJ family response regulator
MCLESFCWKIEPEQDHSGGVMGETTIFLAEGQNHVRQAIRLNLDQQIGYRISGTANHAESLLAQIGQTRPDVLLLDWVLPGMNPQRLLPALRKFCPGTRVIATVSRQEIGEIALNYGVDAYILKALQPDEFALSLTNLVNRLQRAVNKEDI